MDSQESPERLIDEHERHAITGISRAHWWRGEKAGAYPKRLVLGPYTVKWKLSEILAWIDNLPRADDGAEDRQPQQLRQAPADDKESTSTATPAPPDVAAAKPNRPRGQPSRNARTASKRPGAAAPSKKAKS